MSAINSQVLGLRLEIFFGDVFDRPTLTPLGVKIAEYLNMQGFVDNIPKQISVKKNLMSCFFSPISIIKKLGYLFKGNLKQRRPIKILQGSPLFLLLPCKVILGSGSYCWLSVIHTHRIYVWHIYQHVYTIHGGYGIWKGTTLCSLALCTLFHRGESEQQKKTDGKSRSVDEYFCWEVLCRHVFLLQMFKRMDGE